MTLAEPRGGDEPRAPRAVVAYGTLNVISVFAGHGATDPQRFERIVRLWPSGFAALCSVLSGKFEPRAVAVHDELRLLLTETGALIVVVMTVVAGQIVLAAAEENLPLLTTEIRRSFSHDPVRPTYRPRH